MVRETRHLWVGNLPDNIREDRIREHFKRYGRVQSVKLLPRGGKEEAGEMACTVAFMDIKSASKAHTAEHKLDDRTLTTEYYEPAAIPSSSSPPNSSAGYATTSPSSTRFPNGHSSAEEHGNFTERFYDRTNSTRAPEGDYIRRSGYHDNGRGRNRDRNFRNGPYNSVVDRHRGVSNSWSYDNARYNSSQANDTGYNSTATDPNDRRSEQSTKKKTKSRSGSRTPSPTGSTSTRSPSRSRSHSSSSSSSSSSRETSSTGSPKSRRLQSSQPVVHSEDRRPLAICVRNLPLRSSDTSLKDGLFHEYKKHGKVTWVKVVGQSADRQAIVCFKKPEDVEKALEVSYDKLFFGCKIEVAPYQGYDVEDNDLRPYEAEIDEFHPKATRTLFIGNLEKDVTASDLRKNFDQFGEIIEIDIKKQGVVSSYAFCQYSDIVSVVKAIRTMDGEHLNNNRIKLGFGKSMPTQCVWVDGISENVTDKYLSMQFDPFGAVQALYMDREKGQALIFFDQVTSAQAAVTKMRGISLRSRKIQVDFASRECQEAFFENLQKQGLTFERPGFEERRDSATSRSFESLNTNRFSRYDTPTRPRTASYSSRSGAPSSQCNTAAIPSPGTPGSATPRGTGSRSRLSRYEYYDQNNSEYPDRHFRSYDEYSQGSGASHEDTYDHEYVYHESPSHLEPIETRLQAPDHVIPFAPPDIRNLQKERVHLLEQLEDCPSSGDELISPKKRLKLEHLDGTITSDVIIEANRDHRKVMEVRRSSDASLKHLSRRPSVDGKHVVHDRASYLPHAVCKRRKTGGSDSGRVHHYESGESVGGSRPGTPLCDERPEHFAPSEPRRIPREREGPLTLPLPRFASQVMGRASLSVAGIKGQKENILSSPPPAVTSPRISNPKPPSPTPVPPPASPPPRPPSLSSNSSDSDGASPSPSLDERIKSLDEKYEKWSGSRALSTAGIEALAKLDQNRDRFKFRHKLLDLKDFKEVQPSEIVKSVMAKRSVFDEDSKRLENVGEKYEPKDYNSFPRTPVTVQTTVPATTLSTLPLLKVCTNPPPKTPTMLSPRSSGNALTPAKGLQYPFPTHPPMQPSPSSVTPTPPTPSQPPTSTTTPRSTHGDNRLKSCATAPSDNWTPSKICVNRSVSSSVVVSNKTSDANKNIPPTSECSASLTQLEVKTKTNKVTGRRDSSSSDSNKSRRNSETGRKNDDNENCDSSEVDRLEKVRLENESAEREERERQERERQELERLEREREEKERLERLEKERYEKEQRLEKERLERERIEKERIERERFEREKLEKERKEREWREREERERREREEKERRDKEERERREREEKERREREELEREKERKERREKEERERREREEREKHEKEELLEKERRRERDEDKKHKDDNHEKRNDHRHRENHGETRHRDNNVENRNDKNTKDDKKDNHISRKEESRSNHDKSRYIDRELERRKDNVKENKDNNLHEKAKNLFNEIREGKDRPVLEHHLSVDGEKNKDPSRRKERNNSLPATLGTKRRLSAHDNLDSLEETKKLKINQEHRKISERRDSKDGKSKHKNSSNTKYEEKSRHNHIKDGSNDEKRKEHRDERHKNKQLKAEKQKMKSKMREKESSRESPNHQKLRDSPTDNKPTLDNKDFLARLDLVEVEKQQKRKEFRDKDSDSKRSEERKKEHKPREGTPKSSDERSKQSKKDRIRKFTNSSENSDSDEPKKHSIFDIVEDEPAYISMYDKVKARSCKNMQKQEEEKRQEKIKATFSQLKQSRAKREEKKRSTSWDEDSDSDADREKSDIRRKNKMMIASSDDEDGESRKLIKKEMFSDSDSDKMRMSKSELADSSDEDRIKNMQNKSSKSRIMSDSSDEEYKKSSLIKSEMFSDQEENEFADSEEKYKKIKDEYDDRYIRNERKNSKISELNQQIFGDSTSPEIKEEKFMNSRRVYDNSSADESLKTEVRKKHKKKQKRQKNSMSSEENLKIESESLQGDGIEKSKNSEKRKQHSKKEKKRDKTKDENRQRKSKKNKESKDFRRDGKMENIFGSLSDDSEGHKDQDDLQKQNYIHRFTDDNAQSSIYASDSDGMMPPDLQKIEEKERSKLEEKERIRAQEKERFLKEEHRKRKEKKRREKEKRMREELLNNENSLDYVDLGKQLEDNIKDDSNDLSDDLKIKAEMEDRSDAIGEDVFRFSEVTEAADLRKDMAERKEIKEKKKKRKKSKDEKQRHHHHHHHHDKNKIKSPEMKKEDDMKLEIDTSGIFDIPPAKSSPNLDMSITPPHREPLISPIAQTPTSSKEKKRDKFIPGFGAEIDEKIHENAIKSISEFETSKVDSPPPQDPEVKVEKTEPAEEKPRVVISQEETEDAVAALLGESFGSGQFDDYNEPQSPNIEEQNSSADPENVQDDEEMRQAVQSLNSSELEIKPDTPQSENDLQIDTDTEEAEEVSIRYDAPRTPEMIDFSQPPKTPDIPNYIRKEADKSMPNLGSPPSLTPIKHQPIASVAEVKRNFDSVLEIKKSYPSNLSILTENPNAIVAPSWKDNKESSEQVGKSLSLDRIPPLAIQTSAVIPLNPAKAIIKPDEKIENIPPLKPVKPAVSLSLHNMPAQMPYPVPSQKETPKLSTTSIPISRLPITSVMVSKPLQATTLILPQAKVAQTQEIKIPGDDKDKPRVVYKPFTAPRMIVQRPGLIIANHQGPPVTAGHIFTGEKPRPTLTEPPKLVSTSYPLPIEPPKLVSTAHAVSQAVSTPSIIIATKTIDLKPFMPVIQEAPKLVSLTPTQISQPSIIQTVAKSVTTPHVIATPAQILIKPVTPAPLPTQVPTQRIPTPPAPKPQPPIPSQLPVPIPPLPTPPPLVVAKKDPEPTEVKDKPTVLKEVTRTSTPSPVIVATPKVEVIEKAKTPEPPKSLAIEKVTEELNISLKNQEVVKQVEKEVVVEKAEVKAPLPPVVVEEKVAEAVAEPPPAKPEEKVEVKPEPTPVPEIKVDVPVTKEEVIEPENVSVIKETEKFDEEKTETESVVSDISKERLSADIKEDALDSKEDSDYWSAKEVNIDSVIKKVDALCSADELSDRSSEIGKDDWLDEKTLIKTDDKPIENKIVEEPEPGPEPEPETVDENTEIIDEKDQASIRGGRRGGRGRGRKTRGGTERPGVQTRRGKVIKEVAPPTTRGRGGGRGGRPKIDRKITKSESDDVYEFRDDSDENKDRPRLILTIKSPTVANANGNTAVVKEVTKEVVAPAKPVEEFASPANTRKSRRLQEKDVSRNTVDDTIEDVVKNTVMTRAAAAAAANQTRRSTRQVAAKPVVETNRKSPRGGKKKDRRASETTDDSSEEKSAKNEAAKVEVLEPEVKEVMKPPTPVSTAVPTPAVVPAVSVAEPPKVEVREKPHEGLKAHMLRRLKGELNQEHMTLIDPVTGLLTPMRECEEGKYIPLSAQSNAAKLAAAQIKVVTTLAKSNDTTHTTSVITTQIPQQPTAIMVKQQKPQSLKAHVLAKAAQQTTPPIISTPPATYTNKPLNLNVNVSMSNIPPAHLSPRMPMNIPVSKAMQGVKVIQTPPSQTLLLQEQKQLYQQVTKSPIVTSMVNTQVTHQKQAQQQSPINKAQPTHMVQQKQMAAASPPLKQHLLSGVNARMIAKTGMEPGMPVMTYETSLHGERRRSPPPAHQNSPSPQQKKGIAHFTPGTVPLRPPHDISKHYMHAPHVVYHQFLKQAQPYHLSRSPIVSGGLKKVGDGQEGEEAPVTSPPLELRIGGSVGLALTGRSNAVPHSLQSPHDRSTDSPQVGQVYKMHPSRVQYHNRYYEAGEPPPAHRPLTSHSSLAALGNERGVNHLDSLGTPDRPLSAHSAIASHMSAANPERALTRIPERPMSTHLPDRTMSTHIPERPLSTHIPDRSMTNLGPSAVLGAAGNILGAVARHGGADAPTSQRGLQAATPPHASQVPPQADSLLMLLRQYPLMWQGLLALKNDQAAVQMYFVSGNESVAKMSLPKNADGSTPPLRIFQRMRMEPPQVEGVARKMQTENEHCILIALPCGLDHMDVLKQNNNLSSGFIQYLQQKQAAGIINVAAPGTTQPPAYVVHIFPSCDFVNENLRRLAPCLLEHVAVAGIAHLLIVITTV